MHITIAGEAHAPRPLLLGDWHCIPGECNTLVVSTPPAGGKRSSRPEGKPFIPALPYPIAITPRHAPRGPYP